MKLTNAFIGGGGNVTVQSGGVITLNNGSLGVGGILSVGVGSKVTTVANTTDFLSSDELKNAGTIVVTDNSTLQTSAFFSNTGNITISGTSHTTKLEINNYVKFNGTGSISLADNEFNSIVGDNADGGFDNYITISGAGQIGDNFLQVDNFGTINASGAHLLTLNGDTDLANEGIANNDGTIVATGAGGLTMTGMWQDPGFIEAHGTGALTLLNATIGGGGLVETTSSVGSIVLDNAVISGGARVLVELGSVLAATVGTTDGIESGLTVQAGGTIKEATAAVLLGQDHWLNSGTIDVASTLEVLGFLSLQGNGTLGTLNLSASGHIISNGQSAHLEIEDQKIIGGGIIGDANLSLQNKTSGMIENNTTSSLTINTGGNQISNYGSIVSDGTGGIVIDSNVYDAGKLIAEKGVIDLVGVTNGGGTATINGAGEIEFGLQGVNTTFGIGSTGTLRLDHSATSGDQYYAFVRGFTSSDKFDLSDIHYLAAGAGATTFSFSGDAVAGSLKITQGTTSTTINLIGDYQGFAFHIGSDLHGGTLVT